MGELLGRQRVGDGQQIVGHVRREARGTPRLDELLRLVVGGLQHLGRHVGEVDDARLGLLDALLGALFEVLGVFAVDASLDAIGVVQGNEGLPGEDTAFAPQKQVPF